ncbi:hypothetical protein HRbin17_00756 [bacterium HR17]|jgi:Tfp pilus assembly protein PilO|uniref:General secretion pathway protein GspM n=1 Tax=Candidatus Fervidibacter japonicus TaxID=2035412 RepID=A0A2H5XAR7_9BACT|nr:hypothetical protein HRbin17_00756 [bacterium HR17]
MKDGHRVMLVGLAVIALLCWGWAASAFWQVRSLHQHLADLNAQQRALSQRLATAHHQQQRYNDIVRELGQPLSRFEPGQLTARLMEQVEGALTQSRLKVETLQPMAWQVNPDLRCVRLPVQVTATTTHKTLSDALQGITELLQRLRTLRPPLIVERWSMQVVGQPQPAFRVQALCVWLVPVDDAVLKTLAPAPRRRTAPFGAAGAPALER